MGCMFVLIICSFDLISVCWKDYPKGDLIRCEKRTIYFLRCVHCPWPVKVIAFEPAWTSNKAYICFAYVEEWHLLLKLCWFESCFLSLKISFEKIICRGNISWWYLCHNRFVKKLEHETLDYSPMRKNSDNYYKGLLELNSTILYECVGCDFRSWRKSNLKNHLKY